MYTASESQNTAYSIATGTKPKSSLLWKEDKGLAWVRLTYTFDIAHMAKNLSDQGNMF